MDYTIKTTQEKVDKGIRLIQENGGDIEDGYFNIQGVRGSYQFKDGILSISIASKPWLASWDMIKGKLIGFFG